TRRGFDGGALGRDRGTANRPRSDCSRAAVVVAVLVSAAVEEEAAAAAAAGGAGAVVVGNDDRPAVRILLDALCVGCPRRERPIAQRGNNTNHADDGGAANQPPVALLLLEFGLNSRLFFFLALAFSLLAGPRFPDGGRTRARRGRVLESHAAM